MAKLIFIDTNVMLDFLVQRQPHFFLVERLFELAYSREIQLIASTLSFMNCHYIMRRHGMSEDHTRRLLKSMRTVCSAVRIDQSTIDTAFSSTFADMEDGVQHLCALEAKADAIVTRDEKDFKQSQLPVMSPGQSIAWILQS